MPRHSVKQVNSNSCGAAVTMVALQELSVEVRQCTSNLGSPQCEESIWDAMKDLKVGDGVTDWQCTPLSLANFLHTQGLSVAIVHDATRVGQVLKKWQSQYTELPSFYTHYFTSRLEQLRPPVAVQPEINLLDDFNNDARVILLCLIEHGNPPSPLHYLLARKDDSSYWVMNPDGNTDTQLNKGALTKFFAEDVAHGLSVSGSTNYIYTGIALIVRKKP